jgi:hypothetical protein
MTQPDVSGAVGGGLYLVRARMLRAFLAIIVKVPGIAAASGHTAAEWVLRAGGSVILEGGRSPFPEGSILTRS